MWHFFEDEFMNLISELVWLASRPETFSPHGAITVRLSSVKSEGKCFREVPLWRCATGESMRPLFKLSFSLWFSQDIFVERSLSDNCSTQYKHSYLNSRSDVIIMLNSLFAQVTVLSPLHRWLHLHRIWFLLEYVLLHFKRCVYMTKLSFLECPLILLGILWMILLKPHDNSMAEKLWLFPFCRWETWRQRG